MSMVSLTICLDIYSGYTFRLNNILRNSERDEIFKINQRNAFYLRTGIKFKI